MFIMKTTALPWHSQNSSRQHQGLPAQLTWAAVLQVTALLSQRVPSEQGMASAVPGPHITNWLQLQGASQVPTPPFACSAAKAAAHQRVSEGGSTQLRMSWKSFSSLPQKNADKGDLVMHTIPGGVLSHKARKA